VEAPLPPPPVEEAPPPVVVVEETPEPPPPPVVIEEAPAAPPIPDTQTILAQIARLLGEQEFAEAIALFDQIASPDAESANIRLLRASALNSAGSFVEARETANAVIAEFPENMDAVFVLASIEGNDRRPALQLSLLENILATDPVHVDALVAMGGLRLSKRGFKDAAAFYDRALDAAPENGNALVGRALVYRYNHDAASAEAMLTHAVELYPEWFSPYAERARLYRDAKKPALALADLDTAKELAPTSYWVATDRGSVLIDLRQKKAALAEYQRAIGIDSENFLAYVYSAGLKDELGDYDGAEHDYAELARLKPDYYFAFEGLGVHKMRKGDFKAARDAFLTAYSCAPESTYALLAAVNWMKAGNSAETKTFLDQALRGVGKDTTEWVMLKLFRDQSGDVLAAQRLDRERNEDVKAKMLFYLAYYYDVIGKTAVADIYFQKVRELNRPYMLEWRLNEWAIEQRQVALK
jgi:tetratricopeptide (TPR) repeat protein